MSKRSKHKAQLTYRLYGEKEVNMYRDDLVTYCDIYECSDCPRYGDNCDGNGEEEGDDEEILP